MLLLREYPRFFEKLGKLPEDKRKSELRWLFRNDLYALLRYGLSRRDMEHHWLFDRCREVQTSPDGNLDLWPRDHRKSSILTFGLTIFDILGSHGDNPVQKWKDNPEVTVGLFSFSRNIAKAFLRQIMVEFEGNKLLVELFPDVLYEKPKRESAKWSENDGIQVRRKLNKKEATIEAWGVVDSQPTSKHFDILLYDDLVTLDTVNTPDMIQKTLTAWEASLNLGTAAVLRRYIGTRWHQNDPYREILQRGAAEARIHYCTEEKEYPGTPVLLTEDQLMQKRRDMGPYVFAAQMLMNPRADAVNGFLREWLQYADVDNSDHMNLYILVDPASSKKKDSDYTVMWVIGLARDRNYYVIDGVRDRLSLTERIDALFELVERWLPKRVGYEQYGMQADQEIIRMEMKRRNFRFDMIPLGGITAKNDRIARLVPLFEQGRIYLPTELRKVDWEGKSADLVQSFLNDEYLMWPISRYRDMLDCMARIVDTDLGAHWPTTARPAAKEDRYAKSARSKRRAKTSWMVG